MGSFQENRCKTSVPGWSLKVLEETETSAFLLQLPLARFAAGTQSNQQQNLQAVRDCNDCRMSSRLTTTSANKTLLCESELLSVHAVMFN